MTSAFIVTCETCLAVNAMFNTSSNFSFKYCRRQDLFGYNKICFETFNTTKLLEKQFIIDNN